MTTIAYRDGVLAADSQVTAGTTKVGRMTKCGRLPGGYRWAFCGSSQLLWTFVKWCQRALESNEPHPWDGDAPQWSREDDAAGILIHPDGAASEYEGRGWLRVDAPFLAWGSGDKIAIGAMAAGKTAAEAVEVACSIDVYTSGPVVILEPEAAA